MRKTYKPNRGIMPVIPHLPALLSLAQEGSSRILSTPGENPCDCQAKAQRKQLDMVFSRLHFMDQSPMDT
jgi:hypothetical protein